MPNLRLSSEPDAAPDDMSIIENGINTHNVTVTGYHDYAPVRLFLRDESGQVRGGLLGHVWGKWLKIELLWIDEVFRAQGYGQQLLQQAEAEGRAHGALYVYVDTFSFQAPDFYRQHGYEIVAEFADFPPGHSHFFLRKTL